MNNEIKLKDAFDTNIGHGIMYVILMIPAIIAFWLLIKSLLFLIIVILLYICLVILNYYYSNYLVFNKVIIRDTIIEFSNKINNRHESLNDLKEIHLLVQRGANVIFVFSNYEIKAKVYIDTQIIKKIVSNIYKAQIIKEKINMFSSSYKIIRNLTTAST